MQAMRSACGLSICSRGETARTMELVGGESAQRTMVLLLINAVHDTKRGPAMNMPLDAIV